MTRFIPDKIFFKIGEVAEIAEVEQHVLRYWEEEFEILKPSKNKSGQRLYQRKDVDLVLEIKRLLYEEMYTIAGAKKKLKVSKKSGGQLEFGFDREQAIRFKNSLKEDLQALLKVLKD